MRLFISYRRADNAEFVERIRDWLLHRYGRENVFMDFDAIPPFVRFADYIRARLQESDAVIVIVGPRWLELLREKAAGGEDDFVRIEVEEALALGKRIAPICIKGGMMPRRGDVPESLRGLCDYNAASLDSGRGFYEGIERIVGALETSHPKPVTGGEDTSSPNHLSVNREKERKREGWMPKLDAEGKTTDQPPRNLMAEWIDGLVRRASALHEAGDYAGAIREYDDVIQLRPTHAAAYNNRGFARRLAGDVDGAIADYTRAIELDSADYLPYYNRGLAYLTQGRLNEAREDLTKALEIGHPEPWAVHYDLGMVRERRGDMDGALRDYSRAIESKSTYAEAYNNRGGLLAALGRTSEAISDFSLSIVHENEALEIPYTNRGLVYLRMGEAKKAIQDFESALRIKPGYAPAEAGLAEARGEG